MGNHEIVNFILSSLNIATVFSVLGPRVILYQKLQVLAAQAKDEKRNLYQRNSRRLAI